MKPGHVRAVHSAWWTREETRGGWRGGALIIAHLLCVGLLLFDSTAGISGAAAAVGPSHEMQGNEDMRPHRRRRRRRHGAGGARLVPRSCQYDPGVFDTMYRDGMWVGGKRTIKTSSPADYYSYADPTRRGKLVSLSGSGSDFGQATMVSLAFLTEAIREFNITSMVDVPCGDVNWCVSHRVRARVCVPRSVAGARLHAPRLVPATRAH
jgi:hypothetical protein